MHYDTATRYSLAGRHHRRDEAAALTAVLPQRPPAHFEATPRGWAASLWVCCEPEAWPEAASLRPPARRH